MTLAYTPRHAIDFRIAGPSVTKFVVMKRTDSGCRTWLTSGKTWSYLRAHAARFSETEAAELAVGGAVAEKSA